MAYTSTRAYSRPLLNEIVVITVLLHSNFIVFVVFSHFAALSRDERRLSPVYRRLSPTFTIFWVIEQTGYYVTNVVTVRRRLFCLHTFDIFPADKMYLIQLKCSALSPDASPSFFKK